MFINANNTIGNCVKDFTGKSYTFRVNFRFIVALPQGSRYPFLVLARCAPRQKLTTTIANAGKHYWLFFKINIKTIRLILKQFRTFALAKCNK